MQHQLDSEFIETTGTKNLKIATLLLSITTVCLLIGLTVFFLQSTFELSRESQTVWIGFSFLVFITFSPISFIYSIRSFIKKEPGKTQKRIVITGSILYMILTLTLAVAIVYDIFFRLQ